MAKNLKSMVFTALNRPFNNRIIFPDQPSIGDIKN